jgi:hypothetical protein
VFDRDTTGAEPAAWPISGAFSTTDGTPTSFGNTVLGSAALLGAAAAAGPAAAPGPIAAPGPGAAPDPTAAPGPTAAVESTGGGRRGSTAGATTPTIGRRTGDCATGGDKTAAAMATNPAVPA